MATIRMLFDRPLGLAIHFVHYAEHPQIIANVQRLDV